MLLCFGDMLIIEHPCLGQVEIYSKASVSRAGLRQTPQPVGLIQRAYAEKYLRSVLMLFCVHLAVFFISGSEVFPLMCTEDLLNSS